MVGNGLAGFKIVGMAHSQYWLGRDWIQRVVFIVESEVSEVSGVSEASDAGTLYIVPTPIGNLQDITERARSALLAATTIAAEDTRRCRKLLQLLDIPAVGVVPLHEHNEAEAVDSLVRRLEQGETIALVSDAGTPLISDPGHLLLRAVWAAVASGRTIKVVPLPGPSAVITALSVCPLPLHLFTFAGFLPAKTSGRQARINELLNLPGAFVLFEAPHRIEATLGDLAQLIGSRRVFVARELTKVHEQLLLGSAQTLLQRLVDADALRGEFVVVVEGPPASESVTTVDTDTLLFALADELSPSQAAKVAAKVTGIRRADLYARLQARNTGET